MFKLEFKVNGRRVSAHQVGRELERSLRKSIDRASEEAARDMVRKLRRTPEGRNARLVRRGGKLYIEQ